MVYLDDASRKAMRKDLKEFYEKGVGSFKARATYEIEEGNAVISAFPYQVSPSRVVEQIAELSRGLPARLLLPGRRW